MTIFPTKHIDFELIDTQTETIERLHRRTEASPLLTSAYTNKSFRGKLNGTEFQIISAAIGFGAFCLMTGQIEESRGKVKLEINKAFKVLLSVLLVLPIVAFIAELFNEMSTFQPFLILVAVLQVLMIRFVFIEFGFRFLSKMSLNRLVDVLDIRIKKN